PALVRSRSAHPSSAGSHLSRHRPTPTRHQRRSRSQSPGRRTALEGNRMIRESAPYWIGRAYRESWAVGMFNAHHLEATQAIATAADRNRAPVMLSTTMGGIKHVGLDY